MEQPDREWEQADREWEQAESWRKLRWRERYVDRVKSEIEEKRRENRRKWAERDRLDHLARLAKKKPKLKKPKPPPKIGGKTCPKGHLYTKRNTYIVPGGPKAGVRQCKQCMAARVLRAARARRSGTDPAVMKAQMEAEARIQAEMRAEQQARREWLKRRPPMTGISE